MDFEVDLAFVVGFALDEVTTVNLEEWGTAFEEVAIFLEEECPMGVWEECAMEV